VKVLIVAKTRRGGGACVGGITEEGRSIRLIAHDATTNERAGLEYNVGEVWEIESAPDLKIVPPHVENVIVLQAKLLRASKKLEETIYRSAT
jgi:ATP-dependent DNA helicase RecQ